ncbi:UPF0394 membrane protein [Sugiyamaella lignohabitans]|uniref:UPF0394 membrane protein n=1 Tax=Sugiyamaella lignohabitans TaxID=796027 RepID=A0A161HKV1_9ASCO|nr:UPF0394 membrane protein [Sugiyamaella lignohabitans]ANB12508.1 UPF0394 membrane protein [Sugiyamaella lignohabitans]
MFTYFQSAAGALLLHAATSTFLYGNGRVMGCSSILYNSAANPSVFNVPVIAGIALATYAVKAFAPQYVPDYSVVNELAPFGQYTTLIAGLFTGIGTKWGSGCTSGHMLCGLSRLSIRSLVATATFSSVAALTSWYLQTAPAGCGQAGTIACHTLSHPSTQEVYTVIPLVLFEILLSWGIRNHLEVNKYSQTLVSVFSGTLFGLGLLISGLASPSKTLGFLALVPPKFDPSLTMVIFFGIVPNLVENLIRKYKLPAGAAVSKMNLPTATAIPPKFVLGAALFGIGWGLSGICPGPGIIASFLNGSQGLLWLAGFFVAYSLAP